LAWVTIFTQAVFFHEGMRMATIEEETAKRYELMKQTSPWTAIDYLEAQLAVKDARIAELERELTNWPIEYEGKASSEDIS